MKKLLIGCGLLLLLGLGSLGFLAYQVWPELTQFIEQGEAFQLELQRLEEEHPFDAEAQVTLDPERFVAFLDLRVDVRDALLSLDQMMQEADQRPEGEEMGVIEALRFALGMQSSFYEAILPPLQEQGMGLAEVGWHSKIFWATLQHIDGGGDGDDDRLNALRGYYAPMRDEYDQMRDGKGLSLQQLTEGVDPAYVGTARDLMATDVGRVEAGMQEPQIEALALLFSTGGFEGQEITFGEGGATVNVSTREGSDGEGR